jgi:hypothetical protein
MHGVVAADSFRIGQTGGLTVIDESRRADGCAVVVNHGQFMVGPLATTFATDDGLGDR